MELEYGLPSLPDGLELDADLSKAELDADTFGSLAQMDSEDGLLQSLPADLPLAIPSVDHLRLRAAHDQVLKVIG